VSGFEKRDLARGWRFVERLVRDDVPVDFDEQGERELDRQLREEGIDAGEPLTPEQLMAKVQARAGAPRATPRRRVSRVIWLLAAALCVGAAVFWTTRTPRVPGAGGRDARALREQAFHACDERRWAFCQAALDEARQIDPPGEDDARVRAARDAIAAGLAAAAGADR